MAERLSPSLDASQVFLITIPLPGRRDDRPNPAWMKQLLEQLSPREREILPLLAARWTDREIAEALCISHRTVTTHVTHIFDKLGIGSRRDVVPFALVQEGLVG